MSQPLVRITDLSVELGGNPILRGVNAEIQRGQITALIGLNGSGKTTLLRTILKEIPYRGRIEFFCGHDHRRPNPQHVGYVPQKLHIDARLPLTVRDLLALALQRRWPLFLGVTWATERKMVALLQRVFEHRDPYQILELPVENLSGGELQRVLMGLALHPDPELLLLDEPAAGIDFRDQEKFYDLIARLNRESGVTVLLVSHDVSMVNRFAHHVVCLKDGMKECEGTPEDIFSEDGLKRTFGELAGIYIHRHPPYSQSETNIKP
jgi:zinc transport system ATP-binding protein